MNLIIEQDVTVHTTFLRRNSSKLDRLLQLRYHPGPSAAVSATPTELLSKWVQKRPPSIDLFDLEEKEASGQDV